MPKFKSEESQKDWVEAVRRTKLAKKQPAGTTQLPALIKPVAVVPHAKRLTSRPVDVLAAIDVALLKLDEEKAVLEHAKEILSR